MWPNGQKHGMGINRKKPNKSAVTQLIEEHPEELVQAKQPLKLKQKANFKIKEAYL